MKTIVCVFLLASLLINGLIMVFSPNRAAETLFIASVIMGYITTKEDNKKYRTPF